MPPHTLTSHAASRLLYVFTALAAAGVVLWAGFAGAGPVDPQCRGNAPHKICPKLEPASGDNVSGSVLVTAEVPDSVVGVTFAVDEAPLGLEDTEAPFEVVWDTTKSSDGEHRLSATSRDGDGRTSTREHVVNVSNAAALPAADTTAPSVQLTSPAAGATVSGQVGVSADASDNVGVVGVQFKLDGANLGAEDTSAPYGASWDSTKATNGSHTLTAVARDAAGNTSSSQRSVNVSNAAAPPAADTTAPSVQLTSPAAGATVSGQVSMSADASDNVGVVGVQFKLDGANLGSEDTSAPYGASWDSTKATNGSHTLTAVARDAAGNTSSSQRSVTVSNSISGTTTTFLSDLAWVSANNGWGPAERDMSNGETAARDGRPITLAGTTYPKGLGMHAGADVRFALSDCVRFKAHVGVDDEVGSAGSVIFQVYAGATKVYDSGAMTGSTATKTVDVDIAGASELRLVVGNADGSISHDHADWAAARIECASGQRTSDTTAPSVQLTSPAAAATVAGQVSVSADASDNVGVVGVQFKLDGTNLGSEDTSAPYAVSWDSTKATNGSHTLTAVARDAAGNTSSSQRSVTVLNSTSSTTGSLSWAPPPLSNPITVTVTNANRRLFLDNSRDYRLNITEHLKRELWIEGGRNVVVVGGHITVDTLGTNSSYHDNVGIKVRFGDPSGTVHLEGLLVDGPYVVDGIAIATGRSVQIQNVRVERAYDGIKGAHADCVQIQQGVGHLRMDRFTCSTERQGIFLGDHNGPIRSADLRRVNIYGASGGHLFWQTNPTYPVSLSNFWLAIAPGYTAWAPFGYWPYPQEDGTTWDGRIDLTRRSQVSSDGTYLTFVGSTNTISGRINKGVPSGGDWVTRSSVGLGYSSPGY